MPRSRSRAEDHEVARPRDGSARTIAVVTKTADAMTATEAVMTAIEAVMIVTEGAMIETEGAMIADVMIDGEDAMIVTAATATDRAPRTRAAAMATADGDAMTTTRAKKGALVSIWLSQGV